MNGKRILSLLALFALVACNRGTPPPPLYPNYGPGSNPQPGGRPGMPVPAPTPRIDTPQTRFETVKNHALFSQLVQTPVCSTEAGTVELEVFETRVGRIETDDQDREVVCDDFVQILIDTRSSTFRMVEQCLYQGDVYRKHLNTSVYAVEGNTLVIRDTQKKVYAKVEIGSDGKTLNLRHVSAKKTGMLTKSDRIVLKSDTDTYIYNLFCQ